ncbi:unnamed protein product [Adineta steineri]|uniref:G-protein coupled receptors family 1 profile domain-containing protein n=1 Tax=Adineta steineri TaxID=433720 RepID=A0A814BNK7_9BILA|nr:unnamed protein product [Adineta steineri]CAF1421794.1 unnamed protein product [Adineta steineri]
MTPNNTTNVSCSDEDENFVLITLLIVGGWSSIITCILGLLANTFSIIILAHKRMRTLSTNIYLIALAVVNLLWLILFFLCYALRLTIIVPYFISENQENLHSIYNQIFHRLSPYIIPLMNTLQLCIIYYTVAVSVDRYLYISTGINPSQYCTVRNALRIILFLTIFSIIFVILYWFKFRITTQTNTENQTYYKMFYTDIGQQKMFQEIINLSIYIPIVHVIPLVTLILINILTVRRLIKYHDEHRRLISTSVRQMAMIRTNFFYSRRHYHVSIMLIAVVLLFILCRFPMLINHLYEVQHSITDDNISNENLYFQCRIQRLFNIFANFMQTINSNGNLILYLLCCQNFRETTTELFEKISNSLRIQSNDNIVSKIHMRSRTNTHLTDM